MDRRRTLAVVCLLSAVSAAALPYPLAAAGPIEEKVAPTTVRAPAEPRTDLEPSPAYPFGRLSPQAPPETAQFSFMIGAFECTDRLRRPDGTWKELPALWNASYFLNGQGIQDRYWNPETATSNLRLFDAASGRWRVTYFQMPGYASGVWEGGLVKGTDGDRMVLERKISRPNASPLHSRLTFYNIGPEHFDWKGESLSEDGQATPFWTSTCDRKR